MFEELLEQLQATGIPFEAYAWEVAPKTDYGVISLVGGGDHFFGDNGLEEQAVEGTVDLFIRSHLTTKAKTVQDTLRTSGVAWRLDSVQYETETRLVHWSWDFSLRGL